MQIKTIRKIIEEKMLEWLLSITDEQLRKKLKSKILVSGGSITSLFFNEKVNDFDIYIMDRDVLLELVKYYTKPYEEDIEIFKGWEKEALLKKDLEKSDRKNMYNIAIENLKVDQIKLFMGNGAGMKVNENIIEEYSKKVPAVPVPKYYAKFFSPNAISLSDDIQIVVRFWGVAEEVHKTFDFIHATNYFTFDEGLVTNKAALESLLTKQLKYQGSLYPLTTIIRIKKFLKRGWNISAGEMLKVMFQISELDLKDPNVLEEQLVGVDVAYFTKLIEILRGIDNPEMTSQYLNTLIDRVFEGAEDTDQ